jgi:hypothetical protein
MSNQIYPANLQAMIDRASTLTQDETKTLGDLWESGEDLVLPEPLLRLETFGGLDAPVVTNQALIDAWQHALDAAGTAGRVDEIDAARAAGRSAVHEVRREHDTEAEKNGAEEAARSAVLAVGVRDLISDVDYEILVAPWQQVLGSL